MNTDRKQYIEKKGPELCTKKIADSESQREKNIYPNSKPSGDDILSRVRKKYLHILG